MLQGAIAGLAAGGLYAVLGVCLTLMSRLVRVVNFAQAATGMFGAFVSVWLFRQVGLPLWLGSLLGVLLAGLLSGIIGWVAATWLAESSTSNRSAMTVGPLLLLISMSFILFGNRPQPFEPIIPGSAFEVAGVVVSQVALVMVGMAIVTGVAVHLLLSRTRVGTQLRALSERPTTAQLLGIPARRLSVAVWCVTGVISAIAIIIVAPTQSNDATALSMLIVPATAAALLGGFQRIDLSIIGGIALGVLTGLVAQIDQVALVRNFLPLVVIVAVLLWTQRKEVWDAAR